VGGAMLLIAGGLLWLLVVIFTRSRRWSGWAMLAMVFISQIAATIGALIFGIAGPVASVIGGLAAFYATLYAGFSIYFGFDRELIIKILIAHILGIIAFGGLIALFLRWSNT